MFLFMSPTTVAPIKIESVLLITSLIAVLTYWLFILLITSPTFEHFWACLLLVNRACPIFFN